MIYVKFVSWVLSALALQSKFGILFVRCADEADATTGNESRKAGQHVAVIGGGLSGLTAAWYLERKGYVVTVFEKNDRVGGQVFSEIIEGGLEVNDMSDGDGCENGGGNPSELGAVAVSAYAGIDELADELGVPYANSNAPTLFKGKSGRSVGIVGFPVRTYKGNVPRVVLERHKWLKLFDEYPEIHEPGLSGTHPDLYVPMDEFLDNKGFGDLKKMLRTLIVPYGYGYFSTVPAAYFLNAFKAWDDLTPEFYIFPCGFQSFLEEIASRITNVHLGVEVTGITRQPNGTVVVEGDGGMSASFDKVVIASGLHNVATIMDVSEEESDLFSRINTLKYVTTYVDGEIVDEGEVYRKCKATSYAFEPNAVESRIDHVNLFITSPKGPSVAWQILDQNTTLADATDILKQDLLSCGNLKNTVVQRQELWPNYFPTVSTQDFMDGYHDRVEALQGTKNTYYLDSSLSFHLTSNVFEFAKDIVERKFDDVSN